MRRRTSRGERRRERRRTLENHRGECFPTSFGCDTWRMVDDEPIELSRDDEWQAYVDDRDPPDREPRKGSGSVPRIRYRPWNRDLLGMILLRPTGASRAQADDLAALGVPTEFHHATVQRGGRARRVRVSRHKTCTVVRFELVDGPEAGFVFVQEFLPGATTPEFSLGDRVVLSRVAPTGTVEAVNRVPCSFDAQSECVAIDLLIDDGEQGRERHLRGLSRRRRRLAHAGRRCPGRLLLRPGPTRDPLGSARRSTVDLSVRRFRPPPGSLGRCRCLRRRRRPARRLARSNRTRRPGYQRPDPAHVRAAVPFSTGGVPCSLPCSGLLQLPMSPCTSRTVSVE